MRFLLDMNLPPAIAERLREERHDAIHVPNAGYERQPDREIFERATEDGRIVVTFDLDFGEIAALATHPAPGMLVLRMRSARQSYLLARLRVAIAEAGEAQAAGAVVLVEYIRIRVRRMPPGD